MRTFYAACVASREAAGLPKYDYATLTTGSSMLAVTMAGVCIPSLRALKPFGNKYKNT